MATSTITTQEAFATRLQAAHTALLKLTESHHYALPHVIYAEGGIVVQIAPEAQARATVKPFCGARGRFIPGLELVAPDAGTASYLLLDTIAAAKNGLLDTAILRDAELYAHIEKMDGYPTIFEWLQESSNL